jgi:cytochrome d ubiquinol oxidase subunit I
VQALDLARWQFAITTVYHFILVPLTIGLAPLVAGMQTAWVVTKNERWLRLTKFFGKLLAINFALGVATGIVQEFQFGMAWSQYSRFVGDIFGAPLAMEALAAFFVESTFLGLWLFGWNRLSKKVHLTCIWLLAFSVNLSAFFILAANSWMQHPVGAVLSADGTRAEMDSIGSVLGNSTLWAAFPHTVSTAFLVSGTFVAGIATWWFIRLARTKKPELVELAKDTYRPAIKLGAIAMIVAGLGVIISGDQAGKLMYQQQPAKMAAAEGMCTGEESAAFSILTIGSWSADCAEDDLTRVLSVPGLTSYLGTGNFSGPDSFVPGVNDVQADQVAMMQALYGPTVTAANGDVVAVEDITFSPPLAITYWSFRLMIGLGIFCVLLAFGSLWATRKSRLADDKLTTSKALSKLAIIAIPMPFVAASFGWIFTELGRQPWVVAPNPTGVDQIRQLTMQGVSTNVPTGVLLVSMIGFTLLYAALGVVWYRLMHRYTIEGVSEVHDESPEAHVGSDDADQPLSFAY